MERLVDEIRSSFKSGEEITPSSVTRLPYTTAVLEETMRIYPPVPKVGPRVTPKGGAVVCGKYIPENVSIH